MKGENWRRGERRELEEMVKGEFFEEKVKGKSWKKQ
jgi:hypothetical protein